MDLIRVIVAEDSLLVREGIVRVLGLAAGTIEVVAECGDLAGLYAEIERESPDVVVTDIRMPPGHADEGIQVAAWLRVSRPTIGVVVLSQYAEPSYAAALLADGSARRAYLLKDGVSQPGQLVSAITSVATGGSVVDPHIVEILLRDRMKSSTTPLGRLTGIEKNVLDEIALGKSNTAIARALFLSERTVEKHINSVFSKLELLPEADMNRRVMAVLLKLQASDD